MTYVSIKRGRQSVFGLTVEYRRSGVAVSKDLAVHIALRQCEGAIAVVTDQPLGLLSSVRKQWLKLIRQAQREKASTLNRQRRHELNQAIERMQDTSFTAQDPAKDPVAYISFATIEQFRLFPPMCKTLYIASPTKTIDRHMLASWMPRNGVVVIYDQD